MADPETQRVKVWDPWVRAFHWSIVVLLGVSWWSGTNARFEIHYASGYAILALVLFRVGWGLVGSDTARFRRFLQSPLAALRHLLAFPRPDPDTEIGHNAAGGWMVLVMLALLLAQATTGLFADTGYGDYGPLAKQVPADVSDRLTGLHLRIINLILAAVALHVLAIASYGALKGHDLVGPMVTGVKRLPLSMAPPRLGSSWLALGLLACAAGIVLAISRAG